MILRPRESETRSFRKCLADLRSIFPAPVDILQYSLIFSLWDRVTEQLYSKKTVILIPECLWGLQRAKSEPLESAWSVRDQYSRHQWIFSNIPQYSRPDLARRFVLSGRNRQPCLLGHEQSMTAYQKTIGSGKCILIDFRAIFPHWGNIGEYSQIFSDIPLPET